MTTPSAPPRLTLGHTTLAVEDLDLMVAFYRDTLGFHVTDRGAPAPGLDDMVFLSQDPSAHHQIVLVRTPERPTHGFVLADHLAFRTERLDDLRALRGRLDATAADQVIPIDHGNSWSLYFTDPEGNGLEVFVDTPFHVAQPYADALDLDRTDAEIEDATRERTSSTEGFRPLTDWRDEFDRVLAARAGS